MNKYGTFKGDDYVLSRVDTPRAWGNLLSNENYLLQISQLGSGFSIYKTQCANKVTRLSWPDAAAGRFFYIRDVATGKYWSPSVWPVETDTAAFRQWTCTYATGSMQWDLQRDDLSVQLKIAVTLDDNVELHRLTMTNGTGKHKVQASNG